MRLPDGTATEVDRTDELIRTFALHNIDAHIAIGGDGSMGIATALARKGLRIVGVPKTIDNDLDKTVVTFGFDTAVSFATEALADRLHSTAESHGRVMVMEVMGRYAGWIALHCGVAGSADAILIPEIPYDLEKVAAKVHQREDAGSKFTMVVVAEGAKPLGGEVSLLGKELGRGRAAGWSRRKGGRRAAGAHRPRGGWSFSATCCAAARPPRSDRLIALRFGTAAVRAFDEGMTGIMVAIDPPGRVLRTARRAPGA